MAIQWGATTYLNSAEFFAVGIDVSGTTLIVYGRTGPSASIYGTHTLSLGGPWAQSRSVGINVSGGQTFELYRQNVGQANGTYTAAVTISGVGVTASVSRSISFVAEPGAPSNLVNTWTVTDPGCNSTLSWGAGSGASDYGIQCSYDNATFATWWYTSARSFPVVLWREDTYVQVRIFSRNSAGNSAYSNTTSFYTTPKTPVKPTLTRTENGVLVGSSGPKYPYGLEYKRSDGVTGSAGTGTSALAPYSVLDSNAGGANLTYQVRAFVGPTSDRVYSDWSPASDPISTLSAPNPPTLTAPNGVVAVGLVTASWRHNPTDTSGQESALVEYRLKGATAWMSKTVTGATASTTLDLAAGQYEYRVSTKGLADDWSEPSAVGSFQVISLPIVTITNPSGDTVTTASLTVEWTTGQAENVPQSAWRVRLYDNDQQLLDEKSGSGATKTTTFTPRAVDGGIYRIVVETATSGVWSTPEQITFTVSFLPPPKPIGNVVWDEAEGCHRISIEPGDDLTQPFDATAYLGVYRSVDDGETWEIVADQLPAQSIEIEDYQGLSAGETQYRLTAYTALEAEAVTQLACVTVSDGIWLGAGENYSTAQQLVRGPKHRIGTSRNREAKRYSGRTKPVPFDGRERTTTIKGSAFLHQEGPIDGLHRLEEIEDATSPLLYRDHFGRRIYAQMDGEMVTEWESTWHEGDPQVEVSRWQVTFNLIEVEHDLEYA